MSQEPSTLRVQDVLQEGKRLEKEAKEAATAKASWDLRSLPSGFGYSLRDEMSDNRLCADHCCSSPPFLGTPFLARAAGCG